MITKIVLQNFKRFKDTNLELGPHVIFAGQNNFGKTTVIQAISVWHFTLRAWIKSGRKERAIGLLRKEFSSVPLREFNQLWTDKSTGFKKKEYSNEHQGTPHHQGAPRPLKIGIHGEFKGEAWDLTMELNYKNKDQIYVKPTVGIDDIPEGAKELQVTHIPSFSGISIEEHEVNSAYQDMLIGQGKPGDILRNLLQEISVKNQEGWQDLCKNIKEIFGYELAKPSPRGQAFIVCEYRKNSLHKKTSPWFDINTAGSGFQQVLLLLAFLYARPATVLLIDEPDAHLHINLQSKVLDLLKSNVKKQGGQLIIATHSEVLIDATLSENIISFFSEQPRPLSDKHDRKKVQQALKRLNSTDVLNVEQSENKILFLEGHSDAGILCAWATVLKHPMQKWFDDEKSYKYSMQGKRPEEAQEHFDALQAVCPAMRGFVLIDPDNEPNKDYGFDSNKRDIVLRKWVRYEIENYLVHPDAIRRFIESCEPGLFIKNAIEKLKKLLPPDTFENPIEDSPAYLQSVKSSKIILLPVFEAASVKFDKDVFPQLAKIMKLEEIHPDVKNMLGAIASHFDIK